MNWDRMCASKDQEGMGFCHLHEFNIALLGKQAWRLHTHTDSLVSKLYKARYYPRGSFITAELGNNPSFIWRSILEAKYLITKGGRPLIGSGENVSIMNDPWLPDEDNPHVTSSHPTLIDQKVSCLLEMNDKRWDVEVIVDLFNNRDKELIYKIPISATNVTDSWYWSKEVSRIYSVKSAYKLIQDLKPSSSSDFWRALWALKCPPKVKDMLWRSVSNCLPTYGSLVQRHVRISSTCPRCSRSVETIIHCLVTCSFATACWRLVGLYGDSPGDVSFGSWLQDHFNNWDLRERQMGLCSAGLFGKIVTTRCGMGKPSRSKMLLHLLMSGEGDEQWGAPEVNKLKINVDAATFTDRNKYGYSWVLRDSGGHVLQARTESWNGCVNPTLAEAFGVKEVLSWIKESKLSHVTVESDSLITVQAFWSSVNTNSPFGCCIAECKRIILDLNHVYLRFVKRSANRVAHGLARVSWLYVKRSYSEDTV
uniref:RNase H type-1 domain-containing protein n=1 Tax=Cannabis sativa TaxID=3483 RepID=A0A803PGZ2_CANSA